MRKFNFLVMCILMVFTMYGCASTASSIIVTGVNDPLADKVTVHGIINKGDKTDYYFMGYINKGSGSKLYQIYTINRIEDKKAQSDWSFDDVRFMINGKLTIVPASHVKNDLELREDFFSNSYWRTTKVSVASLDYETLDHWAKSGTPIQLRISSSSPSYYFDFMINPKEVSAFLERMDKGK